VMGDSVNVASRIQSLGQANTILFSKEVFDKLKNQPEYKSVSLGKFEFKNVDEPLEIFALTNEGLVVPKREQLSGKLKAIKKKAATKRIMIAAIILVLVLAALFLYRRSLTHTGFTGEKSVAVLPFENTGGDSTQQYITDGITQDIINNLSKISSLQKVIGWFSVKNFRKTTQSLKQIADELGVAAILKGSVEKRGNQTYIIAELIEAGTNNRLWGNEFVYDSKDFLSIQSQVSNQIVTALHGNILPDDRKKLDKNFTENIEAYKLYRRGRVFWDQRTRESYDSAEANYKRAIDLDPDYALAYAGLADLYTFNQRGASQLDAIPIAEKYARKALELDSTLVEAQTTLAFIQSHFYFDYDGAKTKFETIIKNNPNYSIAHLYLGNVLLFTGNVDAGLAETKKALSLDPLSTITNFALGRNYYFGRRYDSAIRQLKETVTLNPRHKQAYTFLGYCYVQKKLYAQALEIFSGLPADAYDGFHGTLVRCYGYAAAGDRARALDSLKAIPRAAQLNFPIAMAQISVALGNRDEAFTYLELAYETHWLLLLTLKVEELWDPLRSDPRFKALLKKMNLE